MVPSMKNVQIKTFSSLLGEIIREIHKKTVNLQCTKTVCGILSIARSNT